MSTTPGRDQRPSPVSRARIERLLDVQGYETVRDDDGDVAGMWNGHQFWFILLGERDEVLQVRGRCSVTLPPEQRGAALLAVNDWNRERIWPKAYVRAEDDGLALYGETSADLEHGVTDEQLQRLLDCGLATAVQLFEATVRTRPADESSDEVDEPGADGREDESDD